MLVGSQGPPLTSGIAGELWAKAQGRPRQPTAMWWAGRVGNVVAAAGPLTPEDSLTEGGGTYCV